MVARLWLISVILVFGVPSLAAPKTPSSDIAPIEIELEEPEPRIVVPPPAGLPAKRALLLQKELVKALNARFGDRVVPVADVLKAQKKERIYESSLRTPQGVARLGEAVSAERAIFVEVVSGLVSVSVYGILGTPPSHGFDVELRQNVRSAKGARELAEAIAAEVEMRAKKTLQRRKGLPLVEKAQSEAQASATDGIDKTAGVHPDIVEELRREEARREAARKAKERPRAPSLALSLGGAVDARSVEVGGPLKARFLPLEHGAVPSLTAHLRVYPLRFVPAWNHARFSDLELSIDGRRAFVAASYQGSQCDVEDDAVTARLRYRAPVFEHPYAPSIGGGIGSGFERAEVRCPLAVPSTRTLFADAHVSVSEPLVPEHLFVEALLAGRTVFAGAQERVPFLLSPEAGLFLVGYLPPFGFARAGANVRHVVIERPGAFTTSDLRASFLIEAGAYF